MRRLAFTRPLLPLAPVLALAALAHPWLLAPACLATTLAGLQSPGLRPHLPPNAIRGAPGTPLHGAVLLTALTALPPYPTGAAATAFLAAAAVLGCRIALSSATVLSVHSDTLVIRRFRRRPRRIATTKASLALKWHFPAWRCATLRIRHPEGLLICGPFHRRRLRQLLPTVGSSRPTTLTTTTDLWIARSFRRILRLRPKGAAPLDPIPRPRFGRRLSRFIGRRRSPPAGTPPPSDAPPS